MDTKQLKQKILDLAIRGKLVPQDPNDEPASVLLERIRKEKEQLIASGKLKKSKSKTTDTPHYENVPFEIPDSWEWCIVDDFAYVATGSTPSKDSFVTEGVPYIKMYNLRNQKIDFDFHPQYIKREVHEGKLQRSKTEVGDLIMNIVGPPLGKLAIIPPSLPESNFNQAAVLIRPYFYKDVIVKYLFYYLSEMSEINSISTKGSAGQVNISLTQSQNMRIPLPPLAEQKRIVAEIEKWFALINEIEQNTTDLQDYIRLAKGKLLSLAISGKLVPQDPNDEPTTELLKRINPSFKPCDTSHYENLPSGWCVCLLKDVAKTISSREFQVLQSEILENGKYPVISQSANYIEGYNNDEKKLLHHSSPIVIFGDHTRIVKYVEFDFIVGADGVKILLPSIDAKYFYYLVIFAAENIDNRGYGRHFSYLSKFPMLVPPFEEQKRIVKKIDEVFSQLDQITAEL